MAKKLKRRKYSGDELQAERAKIFDALNGESPLACAVVGAAFMEASLITLLKSAFIDGRFADDDPDGDDDKRPELPEVFEEGRALELYVAKVDVAYCLGLIGPHMRHNLRNIGHIRNRFAHTHEKIDFTDTTVSRYCQSLKFPKMSNVAIGEKSMFLADIESDPRLRFVVIVAMYSAQMSMTIRRVKHAEIVMKGR